MNRFIYYIDSLLSRGKGLQILWLAVVVIILLALFCGINALMGFPISLRYMVSLMLSPGEFYYDNHLGFQILINLIGLVLVSSLLVSLLSNIVENRATAFTKGLVRYRFANHVLFLGADTMLADTIQGQCGNGNEPIVVLTEQEAEDVRKRLLARITDSAIRRRVVVLYGHRDRREQLLSVYAPRAQRIFILGEPDESDHDTKNILCLSLMKEIAEQGNRTLTCYLLCNHLNTLHILQLQTEPLPRQLHLMVMNTQESWAQRVLVNQVGYPPLYRKPDISAEDKQYVHLVLLGCSQMAYAMAFTTAHIAHYPNYITHGCRTRITMIDVAMDAHSDFLRSHYDSLFRLSRRTHLRWTRDNNGSVMHTESYVPEPEYDFLDIEWQFVSADADTPEVRQLLAQWSEDEEQMLTVAVCYDSMHRSLSTALYLPDELMERHVPILVYQPSNAALANWTKNFTRYTNIYPFGMREDCYDTTFRQRLQWAQAANEAYEDNAVRLNPQRRRKTWYDLKLTLQFSNLYSANYCYIVLRRIEPAFYARLEHQRWLTERLLLGYKAMPKDERVRIEQLPETEKWKQMELLDPYFMHPNIQPFDELTAESVRKDDVMVQCLLGKLAD